MAKLAIALLLGAAHGLVPSTQRLRAPRRQLRAETTRMALSALLFDCNKPASPNRSAADSILEARLRAPRSARPAPREIRATGNARPRRAGDGVLADTEPDGHRVAFNARARAGRRRPTPRRRGVDGARRGVAATPTQRCRGDAAAATWILRVSRRRRGGRDADLGGPIAPTPRAARVGVAARWPSRPPHARHRDGAATPTPSVLQAAFKEKGFPDVWTVEHYGELLETGGGKERMTAHWNAEGWPAGYEDGDAQQALVKELHLRKTAIFNELIEAGEIPLRAGVLRLIDEALAEDVPVGVCSTSSEQAVSNLVRVLMGEERFAQIPIYAGDIVKAKKPAPDVYLLAAEQMKLEPAKCVVIEDSSIGLAAAKAAGMKCIVTKSSRVRRAETARGERRGKPGARLRYAAREDHSIADEIVEDLDQGDVTIAKVRELAG